MKLNIQTAEWSRRYQLALRKGLKHGPQGSLQPALRLGHQAVILGLETLDLALIHEKALLSLASPDDSTRTRQRMIARANIFFTRTIGPIEKTHSAALKTNIQVHRLTQTLRQRTVESSASTRRLERGVARRQAAETALKESTKHRIKLLQESSRLKNRLRVQTQEILSAQEKERRKTSHHLHDEIAQTLLAINLRLLALKQSRKTNTTILEKRIAETQRLVQQSVKPIHKLAHEFDVHHEK